MPASAPRELMVLVERVVRPLPIPLSRQRRLRKELLEHLHVLYVEELQRIENPVEAHERARQRFGNPADISRELNASVSASDRRSCFLQQIFQPRIRESQIAHSIRMLIYFGIYLLCGSSLAITYRVFASPHEFSLTKWIIGYFLTTCLVVLMPFCWFGGFLIFAGQLGSAWEHRPRRRGCILLSSSCLIATWPLALTILSLSGEGISLAALLPPHRLIIGCALSLILGGVYGVQSQRDLAYRREWAELDLNPTES